MCAKGSCYRHSFLSWCMHRTPSHICSTSRIVQLATTPINRGQAGMTGRTRLALPSPSTASRYLSVHLERGRLAAPCHWKARSKIHTPSTVSREAADSQDWIAKVG